MNRLLRFLFVSFEYLQDLFLFLIEILREWVKLLFTVLLLLTIPYLSYVLYDLVSSDVTLAGRLFSQFLLLIHQNQGAFALLIVMIAYITYFKVRDIRMK